MTPDCFYSSMAQSEQMLGGSTSMKEGVGPVLLMDFTETGDIA